jgi:hypothetical protein
MMNGQIKPENRPTVVSTILKKTEKLKKGRKINKKLQFIK